MCFILVNINLLQYFQLPYLINEIQINNKCKAPLIVHVVKCCELKGAIQKKPELKNDTTDKNLEEKRKSSVKRKDQSAKSNKNEKKQKGGEKKEKVKKFSENLTADEEYSIENFFTVYEGKYKYTETIRTNLKYFNRRGITIQTNELKK